MDNYSTHLPFLQFIITKFKPKRVIEFGMGNYSTPLLSQYCESMVSIETDKKWFQKMKSEASHHKQILWSAENVQDYLLANDDGYDLAFIDGPVKSRVLCVRNLWDRAELIVCHDSTTNCYRWDLLEVPDNYKKFDYLKLSPSTSVFTNNPEHWDIFEQGKANDFIL